MSRSRPRTTRHCLAALGLAVLGAAHPALAADPPSELGGKIKEKLAAAGIPVADSDDNTIKIVQTPVLSHWGRSKFDVDPRCKKDSPGCDPTWALKTCNTDADCGGPIAPDGTGLSCVALKPAGDKKMCVGHSDELLNELYDQLTIATTAIDIDSLYPLTGRYMLTLRSALDYLSTHDREVTVRIQYAGITGAMFEGMLADLMKGVATDTKSKVKVYMGYVWPNTGSWNHAKVVAVDGRVAQVSGNNLVENDYLNLQPVHDLALKVAGGAAREAHAFSDILWGETCRRIGNFSRVRGAAAYYVWSDGKTSMGARRDCPSKAKLPDKEKGRPAGAYVMSLPRLGSLAYAPAQPSDQAILALINNAKTSIYLSQPRMSMDKMLQQIPFLYASGGFASSTIRAIRDALLRGVDVTAVFGTIKPAVGDKDAGYFGMTPESFIQLVARTMPSRMKDADVATTKRLVNAALCHLRVANLKFSAADRYPAANHAKFVMGDERVFIVGSHNLYDANLLEYSYLVDNAKAAADVLENYWGRLWRFSSVGAVRGGSNCDGPPGAPGALPSYEDDESSLLDDELLLDDLTPASADPDVWYFGGI